MYNVLKNKIWIKIVSLITVLCYAIVVIPVGFIVKFIGKDIINKKIDRAAKSYWVERKQSVISLKDQF